MSSVVISSRPPIGKISAVPAKSFAHRAAFAMALSPSPTAAELQLAESSADIEVTLNGLAAFGALVEPVESGVKIFANAVTPSGEIDCGESGSTLRFALPIAAAKNLSMKFNGSGRLPERPIGELTAVLREHGAIFSSEKLPFALTMNTPLRGGEYILPGNVSSQYITGLLMGLPLLAEDSTIVLTTPLQSRGYIDITLATLRAFQIEISSNGNSEPIRFKIRGKQRYLPPPVYAVEGDWSNAAFFLAANERGAKIEIDNLDDHSVQPDRAIAEHLQTLRGGGKRVISVAECPDLLPILAVIAATRDGETEFTNAERLRLKESDRLAAMVKALTEIGGDVYELPAGLRIRGIKKLRGGKIDSLNDHRIAMAMTVAALAAEKPITIARASAVVKSYPRFFADWNKLGGDAQEIAT